MGGSQRNRVLSPPPSPTTLSLTQLSDTFTNPPTVPPPPLQAMAPLANMRELRGAVEELRKDPQAARGMAAAPPPQRAPAAGVRTARNIDVTPRSKRYAKEANAENCGLTGAGFVQSADASVKVLWAQPPAGGKQGERAAARRAAPRQTCGESGLRGAGLSSDKCTTRSVTPGSRRLGHNPAGDHLVGAGMAEVATETGGGGAGGRLASRSPAYKREQYSRQHSGGSVRAAMLQTAAPAPGVLEAGGRRAPSREGRHMSLRTRSASPVATVGFGTIPVAPPADAGAGAGRSRCRIDPLSNLHGAVHTSYVPVGGSLSDTVNSTDTQPQVRGRRPAAAAAARGASESPRGERVRSLRNRPSDTLQEHMGVLGTGPVAGAGAPDARSQRNSRAASPSPSAVVANWKMGDQRDAIPSVRRPPRPLIHQNIKEARPRGLRSVSPYPDYDKKEPKLVRGVSRSQTPPNRGYSILHHHSMFLDFSPAFSPLSPPTPNATHSYP